LLLLLLLYDFEKVTKEYLTKKVKKKIVRNIFLLFNLFLLFFNQIKMNSLFLYIFFRLFQIYTTRKKGFNRGYLVEVNITLGIDLINGGFF